MGLAPIDNEQYRKAILGMMMFLRHQRGCLLGVLSDTISASKDD